MSGYPNTHREYSRMEPRSDENEKVLVSALNELASQLSDVCEKEKLWRNGRLSFEYDNLGRKLICRRVTITTLYRLEWN